MAIIIADDAFRVMMITSIDNVNLQPKSAEVAPSVQFANTAPDAVFPRIHRTDFLPATWATSLRVTVGQRYEGLCRRGDRIRSTVRNFFFSIFPSQSAQTLLSRSVAPEFDTSHSLDATGAYDHR
jgi:hypothetical protein